MYNLINKNHKIMENKLYNNNNEKTIKNKSYLIPTSNNNNTKDSDDKKKFEALQDKLKSLIKEESSQKIISLEKRAKTSKRQLATVSESFNAKYQMLTEYTQKLKNVLEEEKAKKNKLRDEMLLDIKLTYKNFRVRLNEQNEKLLSEVEIKVNEFKEKISEIMQKNENCKEELKPLVDELKQIVKVELPTLNDKILKEDNERRNNTSSILDYTSQLSSQVKETLDSEFNSRAEYENCFLSDFDNILQQSKESFIDELKQRENFKENIFKLLSETKNNISTK